MDFPTSFRFLAVLSIIQVSLVSYCSAGTCAETVDWKLGCVCLTNNDCEYPHSRCIAGYCQQKSKCSDTCPCDIPFQCVSDGSGGKFCAYCTPANSPTAVSHGCCSGMSPKQVKNGKSTQILCKQPSHCTKDIECARLHFYYKNLPMIWYCDRCVDGACVGNIKNPNCPWKATKIPKDLLDKMPHVKQSPAKKKKSRTKAVRQKHKAVKRVGRGPSNSTSD